MFNSRGLVFVLTLVLFHLHATVSGADPTRERSLEFFENRIRPVLIEQCYGCHNSSENTEGGLAVDHREALIKGGDGGKVIVPGMPDASRLIAILKHEVEGLEMPEGGPRLDDATIADFQRWIADGAIDPRKQPPSESELREATSWPSVRERRMQWWSFQPIEETLPGKYPRSDSTSNSPSAIIDQFIANRIVERGLTPVPEALPNVLVRRLYMALIGIPPDPGDAQHWAKRIEESQKSDDQPRERVISELVDQLLSNEQFGVRWARHWMDWIRYAESHGSEGDPRIDNAWQYRDYLIRALNSDIGYDQLIKEHVAGDLLAAPRLNAETGINESAIGTAHWRMVFHGFAPTDALDERVRFTDDQINTFSKAFLGLTVSCARCHDHKFDAISQSDYYALFGILRSCRPSRTIIDGVAIGKSDRKQLEELKLQIRERIAEHWLEVSSLLAKRIAAADVEANHESSLFLPLRTWVQAEKSGKDLKIAWSQLRKSHDSSIDPNTVVRQWDLSQNHDRQRWFAANPKTAPLKIQKAGTFSIEPNGDNVLVGVYPAGVFTHTLSQKSPGCLTSDDFILGDNEKLWVLATGDHDSSVRYVVEDYPRKGTVYPVKKLKPIWTWEQFDLDYWSGDSVHVELATALDAPLLVSNRPRSWFGIRKAVIVNANAKMPPVDAELVCLLADSETPPKNLEACCMVYQRKIQNAIQCWQDNTLNDAQALLLDAAMSAELLPNDLQQLPSLGGLVKEYRRLEGQLSVPTRVPGLQETRGTDQTLMIRGNHKTPGDSVPRRFLESVDGTPYRTSQSGRLQLAKDLTRNDNPFVRRVIVNRIWHHLFGRGIVSTPDNIGRLGAMPTHPKLLDYLATQFQRDGWSIKQMIRRIVLSKTWRASSRTTAELREGDPENLLLARSNVRRLEAEAIRDSVLSVSGRLDLGLGGPSVAADSMRRSVFVRVIRNQLVPLLQAFDFPEPTSCVGRRDTTNVPAQSLALMNDPQITRFASDWAQRVLANTSLSDDRMRVDWLIQSAFARPASEDEKVRAIRFIKQTTDRIKREQIFASRLKERIEDGRVQLEGQLNVVRSKLGQENGSHPNPQSTAFPLPIAGWDFRKGLRDRYGELDLVLHSTATQGSDGLHFRGQGYATSGKLKTSVHQKSLEAFVVLNSLDQRGGGVMSIQAADGRVFDAIVFGEQSPGQWLAGSDFHRRTQSFGGKKELETGRPVHLVVTYAADGTITLYRNGELYGKPYKSNQAIKFTDDWVVSFGVRHFPAGGNRMFNGRVIAANLYDFALTAEQVAVASRSVPVYLSEKELFARMTPADRKRNLVLQEKIAKWEGELDELKHVVGSPHQLAWTELAKTLITLKEFIYVR